LKCGVVQTAYANGASTDYLLNVTNTNVCVAKTGVKYVHAAAQTNYDIGIYFEANGHGTILFGPQFYFVLNQAETTLIHLQPTSSTSNITTANYERAMIAFQRLRTLPSLVNQAVGDAICDLLLVDAILFLQGWDLKCWDDIYNDRPSCQMKVKVKDRTLIQTNENETRVLQPMKLQMALDHEVKLFQNSNNTIHNRSSLLSSSTVTKARCFVRPSGTEDVVRIYAEASSQKDANDLAKRAAYFVQIYFGSNDNLNMKSKL